MVTALVLFGVAAVGGLIPGDAAAQGCAAASLPLALVHGGCRCRGSGCPDPRGGRGGCPSVAKTALVVFLIAALGGFYLIAQHLQSRPLPIPVMLVHAAVAVTAFLILLAGVLKAA